MQPGLKSFFAKILAPLGDYNGEGVEISEIGQEGLVHQSLWQLCANFHEILTGELLGILARVKLLPSEPPGPDESGSSISKVESISLANATLAVGTHTLCAAPAEPDQPPYSFFFLFFSFHLFSFFPHISYYTPLIPQLWTFPVCHQCVISVTLLSPGLK